MFVYSYISSGLQKKKMEWNSFVKENICGRKIHGGEILGF